MWSTVEQSYFGSFAGFDLLTAGPFHDACITTTPLYSVQFTSQLNTIG